MTSTMDLADMFAAADSAEHHSCLFGLPDDFQAAIADKQNARAALEQRIKELEADAKRLEHLCKSVRCSSANIDGNHGWNFLHGYGWKTGATFREAIDRAMSEAALTKAVEISQELGLP